MTSSSQAEGQERRLVALVLAISDMQQVWETARYLLGEHPAASAGHAGGVPWQARRALETGLVTCYGRPFTGSHYRVGRPRGLTAEERELHKWLIDQRNQVYAHSDKTDYRRVLGLDASDWREHLKTGVIGEQWTPPTSPELLRAIRGLAAKLIEAFWRELRELSDR